MTEACIVGWAHSPFGKLDDPLAFTPLRRDIPVCREIRLRATGHSAGRGSACREVAFAVSRGAVSGRRGAVRRRGGADVVAGRAGRRIGRPELGLPPVIDRISEEQRGLILVTGATGSGKSTTLAAMIDRINSTRSGHIITIEDPIEFLHRDKRSFVTQREVDVDTRSFNEALRGALRQDPDVILVGEMRDHETIETALTAAETGHLVLSTLHTLDATETITRIVSSFAPHQQKSVRLQLAGILKGVISMRLVRAAKGHGRVPAIEVMVSTGFIRDCIINEEKTAQIREALAAGYSQYGMQTFDQSLFHLYQSGLISLEEALRNASNAGEFRMKVAGIQSSSEQAKEDMARIGNFSSVPPARAEKEVKV